MLMRQEIRATIAQFGVQRGAGLISPIGQRLSWLIDMRCVLLRPEALSRIAEQFWELFSANPAFQIGGMEVAAIPLLVGLLQSGLSRGRTVNGFIIRKERKPTGRGQAIEGQISDDPIILVDDVLNSGDSLEKARIIVEREGRQVHDVFVVIDYRSKRGLDWREKNGIKVTSLFTLEDFGLTLGAGKKSLPSQFVSRWRFQKPGGFAFYVVPKSAPVIVDDLVCFGTDSASFCAVDIESGNERWSFKAGGAHRKGIWSTAAYHDGKLFFGAYNGCFYCIDAKLGKEVWRNSACEWIGSSPLIVPAHGVVIIGLEYERPNAQGSMAALSLTTGEKLWEHQLRTYQHGSASYWAAGDLAICGTNDHSIIALEARTGNLVWTFRTRRSVKYPPRIDDKRGLVIAASFDGNIYVLRASSGELVGTISTHDICYTTPLIAHGRVFCGSGDRHLYVIDLDRVRLVRRLDCGARVYSSPRLINGRVAFGSNGGLYREIDPITLETLASIQVPDAITNAIAATGDGQRILIPTCMNELYCYDRMQPCEPTAV